MIQPGDRARITRRYVEGTNVVETRFDTPTGTAVLTDAMSVADERTRHHELLPEHELIRRVECVRGFIELDLEVSVPASFGRHRTRVLDLGALGIRWEIGSQLLTLRGDRALALGEDGCVRAHVRLSAGNAVHWSLSFDGEAPAVLPPLGTLASERIARSIAWWRNWIARTSYDGPHRELVLRSALFTPAALSAISLRPIRT